MPNPDFQTAMEAIELDAVNRTNEINTRLKHNMDEANTPIRAIIVDAIDEEAKRFYAGFNF